MLNAPGVTSSLTTTQSDADWPMFMTMPEYARSVNTFWTAEAPSRSSQTSFTPMAFRSVASDEARASLTIAAMRGSFSVKPPA